jgi:hypothetical protein
VTKYGLPDISNAEHFQRWRATPDQWSALVKEIARNADVDVGDLIPFASGANLVVDLNGSVCPKLIPSMFAAQLTSFLSQVGHITNGEAPETRLPEEIWWLGFRRIPFIRMTTIGKSCCGATSAMPKARAFSVSAIAVRTKGGFIRVLRIGARCRERHSLAEQPSLDGAANVSRKPDLPLYSTYQINLLLGYLG